MMKCFSINNRRYLGAKTRLLPMISKVVNQECKKVKSFADIFAGTGVVAKNFHKDFNLFVNDILKSNYHSYMTWFGDARVSNKKLCSIIEAVNSAPNISENYFSKNFSNTYFSRHNAKKIGYFRELIQDMHLAKEINSRENSVLLTSLIYSADRIANTCGHYDSYRRQLINKDKINFIMPAYNTGKGKKSKIYNKDANKLVREIRADVVYIDPPYNSRQYSDTYHLLENLVEWKKQKVFGVAKKVKDRAHIKSLYCTKEAVNTFYDLINNIDSRYIIVSFNNMENRGNHRSHSKIKKSEIINILRSRGKVKIYTEDFNQFNAGKTIKEKHKEILYVCEIK